MLAGCRLRRLEVVGGGGGTSRSGDDGAGRRAGGGLALLELGEEGLVLLVQLLRLPPHPLVLLHDEQVLQALPLRHPPQPLVLRALHPPPLRSIDLHTNAINEKKLASMRKENSC